MELHSDSFPDSQRKGLEKRFQMQKYISKPDRKKLAERLGLKDSQVNFIFTFIQQYTECHAKTVHIQNAYYVHL